MGTHKKEGFGSKIGFVLAAAGSAVGLGNIWRFPYLAAKYGGGVFLVIYIILAVTFGFTMMITEISIGRRTGKSVIAAYGEVDKRFRFMGPIASVVPFIITPYYCVIGGWVIKYLVVFITGKGTAAADDGSFFTGYIGNMGQSTIYFGVFAVITAAIIIMGVTKGIEKISKIMMPLLIACIIGISIYCITIPGSSAGIKYYLLPDFSGMTVGKFFEAIVAAVGQLFYSLSIAMGILFTYGSYMRKEDSIEKSVHQIEIFDTGVALLAGFIIVPAVYVFSNGDAAALNKGPSLMFITLPNVFLTMKGGQIVGTVFFLLVALAALTSSISLLEAMVSIIKDKFNLGRVASTIICFVFVAVLGMTSVLGYSKWEDITIFGYQFLDFYDFVSNNVLMPIVAFITCILIGYFAKTKYVEDEVCSGGNKFAWKILYRFNICILCPIFLAVILITNFVLSI